jgi:hypothetical protein
MSLRARQRASRILGIFAPLCVLALLCGCEGADVQASSKSRFETQYGEFQDALRQCEAQTGYDPQEARALGPYELGAGELQWRDCAYAALRMLVVPNTAFPMLYADIIDKDKELTRGIQDKRVTRDERETQIAAMRQAIIEREENYARLESGQRELEERMRIDMITNSTQALTRNVQRRAR